MGALLDEAYPPRRFVGDPTAAGGNEWAGKSDGDVFRFVLQERGKDGWLTREGFSPDVFFVIRSWTVGDSDPSDYGSFRINCQGNVEGLGWLWRSSYW